MAAYMNCYCYTLLFAYLFTAPSSIRLVSSSSSSLTCHPRQSNSLIYDLQLQCPFLLSSSSPAEMNGESLERVLSSKSMNTYTAVLFYASWCPFSSGIRSKFDVLGSMFPQIGHITVEQSSTMPSLFSRYGIHSLPALLIVNQTTKIRYYGPRDLQSMVHFYKITTGLDPVEDLTHENSYSLMRVQKAIQPLYQMSWDEMIVKEPYLAFAVLFLILRAFLYFCPNILSRLTAIWVLYKRHLNFGIFGESSQLLGRIVHLIDVKRVWSNLKLCKTRNFHKGARSAQVWASSLASVSLGETSSARPSSSVDS
ncbi:5-adenylylsulfate reductase-like [Ancistrocladus abbreviatus]